MEPSKEPVVERITQLVRRYPSRSAAARAWGVNINTLKSYYRKDGLIPQPRENLLARIADSEGVSLEWLKTGIGESPIEVIESPKSTVQVDPLSQVLEFLTSEERLQLATILARKGVETVLYLLDEDNIELMRQDPVVKAKMLGKPVDPTQEVSPNVQEKRERDTDGELQTTENDLANSTKKKQAR